MENFCYTSVVTRRLVLERVSQECIFEYILKEPVDTERKYISPFRVDKNAGCYFRYDNNNVLWFWDWAAYPNHYDCFQLYEKVMCIPHETVYEHIYHNVKENESYAVSGHSSSSKKRVITKQNSIITILEKNWDKKEIEYWQQYGITQIQLDNDKVKPVKAVMISKGTNNFSFQVENMAFAYTDFEKGHKKIYQPLNKKGKWYTNCSADDIGNINKISNYGDLLIITKSYKDCRVIRNCGYVDCIWFQNEGMCPSKKSLETLLQKFRKIRLVFDNDRAGIEAADKIREKLSKIHNDVKFFHMPEELYEQGIKDPSDFVKAESYKKLKQFLKENVK